MDWDLPESVDTGDFLREEGAYHLLIDAVNDQPLINGDLVDGIECTFRVLAGSQAGKTFNEVFSRPRIDASDNARKFFLAKRAKLLIATSIATEAQLGKSFSFDPEALVGRQLCANVELQESKRGKLYARIRYADLYHVDDREAKNIERDMGSIGKLPASQRLVAGKPAQADGRVASVDDASKEVF